MSIELKKLGKPSQLQSSLNCFSTPTSSPLFSVPLSFSSYSIHALVDTGAFSSALTPDHLTKIRLKNPNAISNESKTSIPVKVANGQKLSTLGSVVLTFKLGGQSFSEPFLLLKTMNRPILGLPFFEKNNITINPSNRTLSFPEMTLQLNEIASLEGKITKSFRRKSYYLKTQQKLVIKPNTQEVSNCILLTPNCLKAHVQ